MVDIGTNKTSESTTISFSKEQGDTQCLVHLHYRIYRSRPQDRGPVAQPHRALIQGSRECHHKAIALLCRMATLNGLQCTVEPLAMVLRLQGTGTHHNKVENHWNFGI